MPPAPIRRPLTITTWVVVSVTYLALSPVLLLLAGLASRIMKRPQALVLARLAQAYFARELGVLLACGWLWILSGAGRALQSPRMRRAHHRLLAWFVHGLVKDGRAALKIELAPEPSPEAAAALARDRPLLCFSRHAGPGDTLILIDLLITHYRRLPGVVFKDALTIDPSVDLIAYRLPHAVLDASDRQECEDRIAEVSAGLPPRGTLLLFPEGGNFTPERRRRALRKLWRQGRRREASAGEAMEHVLPPHPSGALAALRGNPQADIIFAAHTGLGQAAFPRELWRNPPIGKTFTSRMWLAPVADRPTDPDEQVKWLYDWWKRLDEWVEGRGEERGGVVGLRLEDSEDGYDRDLTPRMRGATRLADDLGRPSAGDPG
jgi:1-acyl-sn-glycerol-3-phosphate acyltransferase